MNNKTVTIVIASLLITATTMAALIAEKKQVVHQCRDVRVAMDGAIDAVIESGGLTAAKTNITIFKEHNRRRVKLETVEVISGHEAATGRNPASASDTYSNGNIKLTLLSQVNPKNGQRVASIKGEINGEKISALLGCR